MRYIKAAKNVEFYKKGDYMIRRDKYLQQLIQNRNNGFPKIITGIRRCGKSYLLKEIYRQYLTEQGTPEECILIVELDDDRNIRYRDPSIWANMSGIIAHQKKNAQYFWMKFKWFMQL